MDPVPDQKNAVHPLPFQLSKIHLNINRPCELRSSKRFQSLKVFWIEICTDFSCMLDALYIISSLILLEVYVKSAVFLCRCQLADEQICSVLVNYSFRITDVYTKYWYKRWHQVWKLNNKIHHDLMSLRKQSSDHTRPNFLICYNDGGMANCGLQAGCDLLDRPV
jgi:hypothetical protein